MTRQYVETFTSASCSSRKHGDCNQKATFGIENVVRPCDCSCHSTSASTVTQV